MPVLPTLPWPALIFWAAIVGGLLVAALGLIRRRPSLLIGGAILLLPASLYLTATPRFQYVGWVPVACQLLAAAAVRRDQIWKARESRGAAVALYFMYYNFARIHQALRTTPVQAAGVTDRLWEIEDIVTLLD